MPKGRSPPPGFGIITRRTGADRYVFRARSSRRQPCVQAHCFDLCERDPVHAGCTRVGAGKPVGVVKDVRAADLVIEQVEAECRLRLRLTIQPPLKGPDLIGCFEAHGQSPPPLRLRKHTRSQGPSLRRSYPEQYYAPVRLPPDPPPEATSKPRPPTGRVSPVTRITFPACRAHYPGGSRRVRLSIASPLTRPSPLCRRVGIRTSTFEACSGFTRVTARRIARPPKATFVTRLRSSRSPDQTARQLPEQPTTLWVEPPSTGDPRHRGALHKSD
jgi:hypothetical protein